MMSMKYLCLSLTAALASLGFASLAVATDLPNNSLITQQTSSVDFFEVTSVALARTKVEPTERRLYYRTVLEIKGVVQGNLCTADPKSVAMVQEQESSYTEVKLSATYKTEPYSDVLRGCFAYGRISDVKLAIKLDTYYDMGESSDESFVVKTFLIKSRPLGSRTDVLNYITIEVSRDGEATVKLTTGNLKHSKENAKTKTKPRTK